MITDQQSKQSASNFRMAADSPLATTRLKQKKSRNWLPFFGVILIIAGIIVFAAVSGMAAAKYLLGLWSLFAMITGIAAVMGFAIDRKPRSPVGGMLLLFVGTLFFLGRFNADLNPLQIYGRFWIVLLGIFAAVELLRYYTHRQSEGKPPKLFGFGRLVVIALIVGSGVVANRVAMNGSFLGATPLPGFLSNIRDSMIGETHTFTDEPLTLANLKPGSRLLISNSYGNVKVTGGAATARVTLSKGVRAWSRDNAGEVAGKITPVLTETASGEYTLATNREAVKQEVANQFSTNLEIEVPAAVTLVITNSYGTVSASKLDTNLQVTAKHGRVETADIRGDVSFELNYSSVSAAKIGGAVRVTGAKDARLSNIEGSVEIASRNGDIELRNIGGEVKVEASRSRITAQDLAQFATLKTTRSPISVTSAAGVSIETQHSKISVAGINGDLDITTERGAIEAERISGSFTVVGEHTEVEVDGVQGAANIATSHAKVEVRNFRDSLKIQTSHRDVVFSAAGDITRDIVVENSHGDIKAILPQTGNYRLDAESDNGNIRTVNFADISSKRRKSFSYTSGLATAIISLRTSYNTIVIQAASPRTQVGATAPGAPPLPQTPPARAAAIDEDDDEDDKD